VIELSGERSDGQAGRFALLSKGIGRAPTALLSPENLPKFIRSASEGLCCAVEILGCVVEILGCLGREQTVISLRRRKRGIGKRCCLLV
jgi:hypothetical protein